MGKQFLLKIKESTFSIVPIIFFVFLLNFTPIINLSSSECFAFLLASILIILGIALFNMGADIAMTPMGKTVGVSLTKQKKLGMLLTVSFIIGLLVTIAEPDLLVLASQVKGIINPTLLIVIIGVGVGLFLMIAILKIILKKSLSFLLVFFNMVLFAIAILVCLNGNSNFLPLAFDSGGVTTGPITVPFVMALGIGVASSMSSKDSKENSFGFMALCSIGAILCVSILSIFIKGDLNYVVGDYTLSNNIFSSLLFYGFKMMKEVGIVLGLIVVVFLIIQFIFIKLNKKQLAKLGIGICFTFLGLVIFLTAVNTVYITIGFKIGSQIALTNKFWLIPIGAIMGFIVIVAEPAIHVLNKQVEETTNGMISKKAMLIGLSIGGALATGLSMIRIVFDFNLMYYLVPGYIIALGMSFFVPQIYTAIAFDSGGVSSGPLTSSFILPLVIGACMIVSGEGAIMNNAFGVVAMVAMTPLITIQILGFSAIAKKSRDRKIAMNKILNSDDCQIIDFL